MAFGESMSTQNTEMSSQAIRVLAKSMYKELKRAGYDRRELVAFAGELLDLVTHEIRCASADNGTDGDPHA